MGGSPVEVGGRVVRLVPQVTVEVGNSLVEALGKEIGYSPAEIYAVVAGTQADGLFEVFEGFVVFAQTAFGDGPVVVAVGKYGIDFHAFLEIGKGAPHISEIVFGYSSVEVGPAVVVLKGYQYVELLDGL